MYIDMKNKLQHEYTEKGVRYMQCQNGCCYISVADDTQSVKCYYQVHTTLIKMFPESVPKKKSGRPAGWHFMAEYVDTNGNVYHKGEEQPELKGTLPPTKVTKKKTKRRSKAELEAAKIAKYRKAKAKAKA